MTKYLALSAFLVSLTLAGFCGSNVQSEEAFQFVNDGMPFGKIMDADVERLMEFARAQGVDLKAELQKAYAKDTKALGRVFEFSLSFNTLDQNARTYGQVIYSSLLNLGETIGREPYSEVVLAQKPEVQQRIRDFLYFPMTRVPMNDRAEVDKEVREDFPRLFPKDYQFGHDDPLFEK